MKQRKMTGPKYDENKSLIDAVLDSVDIVSMPEDSKEEGSEATSAESMLTDAITEGKDSYSKGNYIVGKDNPAGEYRLYALSQNSSGSGYYCVYPDAARSDILENEILITMPSLLWPMDSCLNCLMQRQFRSSSLITA